MEDYLQNKLNGYNKFTTQEFYQWMKEQLFFVYKQSYQMAFDMARKAEKAYQFELGNTSTNFIQYGYFDGSYQGLTSGEQLHFALRQMEKSFIEQNKREFELTKHISLLQLNPLALIQLKETGHCEFNLPEEMFDMDFPGHYFRRIKSSSLSIPCIAGPYTTVNATLRLLNNSIRINTSRVDNVYERNNDGGVPTDDDRFVENRIPCSAIAASSAQNDAGVFELNFRDERYLPFEGAGAISKWRLELNGKYAQEGGTVLDFSQFDYNTISDIVLHLKYTAREDAGPFKQSALNHLTNYIKQAVDNSPVPFMRLFNLKHEFPDQWHNFLNKPAANGDQVFNLDMTQERFPYFVNHLSMEITGLQLFSDFATGSSMPVLQISSLSATPQNFNFAKQEPKFGSLSVASGFVGSEKPGNWKIVNPGGTSQIKLADGNLFDLFVVASYKAV